MAPRLWQRQPGETPADFTAFAAYLRLKGRRSHRATAEQSGRSLAAIRRLSAKFNWPGRVAAFENRLADATQDALDSVVRAAITTSKSDLEQFRIKEFLLAHQIIHESKRWLELASNPRRHQVSIMQICRLTELAFKLKCLATGMPYGDEPRRRSRPEDRPGYWTAPSVEEALHKIYGSPLPGESPPPPAASMADAGRAGSPLPAASGSATIPASSAPPAATVAPASSASAAMEPVPTSGLCPPPSGPVTPVPSIVEGPRPPDGRPQGHPRCDAWSRMARQMRRR